MAENNKIYITEVPHMGVISEIPLDWLVGHMRRYEDMPDEFVTAKVPGAAQVDWAAAKGTPDWNRDVNFNEYRWMEDVYWVYTADIPAMEIGSGRKLLFQCGGVDYKYDVLLNNDVIYSYEGMFKPFELDVGEAAAGGATLKIRIHPIPKYAGGEPDTRQEASYSCKPAVSYGWDWHPRLVPSGIWGCAALRVVQAERITSAEVSYELNEELTRACITVNVDYDSVIPADESGTNAYMPRFKLYSPAGDLALETTDIDSPLELDGVKLWWCNGYGEPSIYKWELFLEKNGRVIDKTSGKVGFRKVELNINPGAWAEPADFPKTRSRVPITLTLNNIPIFAKGSNWVNPEIFPGNMDETTYRKPLEYARDANMNLLRVWGGGIVNKESFFEFCDEFGLMIWQEFPLACNKYPDDPQYLNTLESEARAIIQRLRGHACHVIWCGGNELFNNWSLMTDQSLPLRLLNKLCYELDRGKPYINTSPLFGMAHGCYLFVYPDGREVYEAMAGSHFTAYTEFGIPSISNMQTCLAATDEANLFPLARNEITVAHHAFDAWDGGDDTWSCISTLEKYFGKPDSLEQLIKQSQWLQCEGYKCIFEEARRQKPYCSMALNWCYNEPWPTIANNSLLNYPADPKPAYYAVAQSCRNRLVSARIPKFTWRPGEEFYADLWLLNDGVKPIPVGAALVYLEYCDKRQFLLRWDYPETPPNKNLAGPTVRYMLPPALDAEPGCRFVELTLVVSAREMSSEYKLILYPGNE